MTDNLPILAQLTEKQAKFVQYVASGLRLRDAYRNAYDTEADDDLVSIQASKLKSKPVVSLALKQILRAKRLEDMDSVGELIAETKEDQHRAREDKAHAAVASFARMRGTWLGLDQLKITHDVTHSLTDEELIERLAGNDPDRIKAAKTLIGQPEGFPETIDADYQDITSQTDDASVRPSEGQETDETE